MLGSFFINKAVDIIINFIGSQMGLEWVKVTVYLAAKLNKSIIGETSGSFMVRLFLFKWIFI